MLVMIVKKKVQSLCFQNVKSAIFLFEIQEDNQKLSKIIWTSCINTLLLVQFLQQQDITLKDE